LVLGVVVVNGSLQTRAPVLAPRIIVHGGRGLRGWFSMLKAPKAPPGKKPPVRSVSNDPTEERAARLAGPYRRPKPLENPLGPGPEAATPRLTWHKWQQGGNSRPICWTGRSHDGLSQRPRPKSVRAGRTRDRVLPAVKITGTPASGRLTLTAAYNLVAVRPGKPDEATLRPRTRLNVARRWIMILNRDPNAVPIKIFGKTAARRWGGPPIVSII